MNIASYSAIVAVALLLSSCAAATPYAFMHQSGPIGGWVDGEYGPNAYEWPDDMMNLYPGEDR